MRGHVLPIVSISHLLEGKSDERCLMKRSERKWRLIVVSGEDQHQYCILAAGVKKIGLSAEQAKSTSAINVNGFPIRVLQKAELVQGLGEKNEGETL